MKVSQWAEIRRLAEVEGLSQRQIAARLRCGWRTVKKALAMEQPPDESHRASRGSILDPYKPKIDALVARYPELSGTRVLEEIRKQGYPGQICIVREYLRQIRPLRGRIYQEVFYEPGEALQVDWGTCGKLQIGGTIRTVSVLVAVLCYSRLCYIEFCLSQRKAEFYRSLVHALEFFGGSPLKIILDNLKAAILNGSGRTACLHPEFLALCGHFCLEPVPCARRDPESKGIVEAKVRYVKRNALQGRDDELTCWDDYGRLAVYWRDQVANVRIHQTTKERPVDRYEKERGLLRPLPAAPFDTDEIVSVVVNSHARVKFDGNRYSTPPSVARQTAMLRASGTHVRVIHQGEQVACHPRSYDRGQLIRDPGHHLEALKRRRRAGVSQLEQQFDDLGAEARAFHLALKQQPVRTIVHLKRLLKLVRLYGRGDVIDAITRANQYQTYDAAYVETILLQQRRRQELPSPTPVRPRRTELVEEIELDEPDPAVYDRFCQTDEDDPHEDTFPEIQTSPQEPPMSRPREMRQHELLLADLAELKLNQIAETYREVLDEASRQNTSMLQVLATLIAGEVTAKRERALERRIRQAKLPPRKTLENYNFNHPQKIAKQKILRLFDCEFVSQHQCAVLIGKTGLGKSHLLNALGYTACEKGISVRWTRAIEMINVLTTAQINGTLEKRLKEYTRVDLLLLDELGYLPIDKRGADLMFQVVAARYECGSIVITTNRMFRDWGKIFDVDNTLATAIIDRLMHHGEALVIDGESYRTRDQDDA